MEFPKKEQRSGIRIQIVDLKKQRASKSLTIYNINIEEAFYRILILLESISKNDEVEITHYK